MNAQNRAKIGLAVVGFAIGWLHLPISLAFNVTLGSQGSLARSIVMLLYPVAVAVTGLGAVLAMKYPAVAKPGAMRVAGISILFFLFCTLRFNFFTESDSHLFGSTVCHIFAIAMWYLSLGAAQAGMLSTIKRHSESQIGLAWAIHLLGLFLGYLASEGTVVFFGVSVVLAAAGIALSLSPRWSIPLVGALLLVGHVTGAEMVMEKHRLVDGLFEPDFSSVRSRKSMGMGGNQEPALPQVEHLAWSRFGQFRVHLKRNGDREVRYNLRHQYTMSGRRSPTGKLPQLRYRNALYTNIPTDQTIAIVGTGGGRSLLLFPAEQLQRITAVERDPSAADFFYRTHPEVNEGVYQLANFINADGRHAIERSPTTFDNIIFESSLYQPSHTMLPMATPFYYLTKQALAVYSSKLNEGGLLVFEVRSPSDRGREERDYLPSQVVKSMKELGFYQKTVRMRSGKAMYLLASTNEDRLAAAALSLKMAGKTRMGLREQADRGGARITDDEPFASWSTQKENKRWLYLKIVGALAVVGVVFGVLLAFSDRRSTTWKATGWFWILGYFHAALQFHTFHMWRSFFGDSLKTVWWLIIIMLAMSSIASVGARPIAPLLRSRWVRVVGTVVLLGLHFAASLSLPFGEASNVIRFSYAVMALIPTSALLGLWMPLGLGSASTEGLGTWLAADAIGTLVAACGLFLLMIPLGGTPYGWTVVVSGLLVAWAWRPSGS
jgi:spermidine synthase